MKKCVDEYEVYYRPELERKKKEQIDKEIERQKVRDGVLGLALRCTIFSRINWRS